MFKKYKISSFTGRINAFRVIERLKRTNILGGQNTESDYRLIHYTQSVKTALYIFLDIILKILCYLTLSIIQFFMLDWSFM